MNTTSSIATQTTKGSVKGIGKVIGKVGGKVLMPLGAALDTYDTVKNPKFEGGWDYLNPVKMTYTAAHKTPIIKNIINKSDKFFENIGSKIYDATDNITNNESKEVNKIVANKDEKNEMQKDDKLSNNAKVLGAIGLTGASILAYKLYKRHKEKNKNMKKSFNEYNTLAGKMNNFSIGTTVAKGIKGLYELGKNTLKAGVKNRYTKSGIKKTSMVGANGKPIYDIKPDTLNMTNIGKDAGYTALGAGAAYGGIKGLNYVTDKTSNAIDTATDYKDALLHNKETKNKNINKSVAGLKLAGAGVVGAMTGGVSGAILTPLGGYLGRSYGVPGELVGGTVGLVGGAVMDKYLKRLKNRQQQLKLQKNYNDDESLFDTTKRKVKETGKSLINSYKEKTGISNIESDIEKNKKGIEVLSNKNLKIESNELSESMKRNKNDKNEVDMHKAINEAAIGSEINKEHIKNEDTIEDINKTNTKLENKINTTNVAVGAGILGTGALAYNIFKKKKKNEN